jgi:hypothetical protein
LPTTSLCAKSNAVFALNGRVFRKPVTLLAQHGVGMAGSNEDTLNANIENILRRALDHFGDFEILRRRSDAPAIPPTPLRIAAGTASPDNPAGRNSGHQMDAWERRGFLSLSTRRHRREGDE